MKNIKLFEEFLFQGGSTFGEISSWLQQEYDWDYVEQESDDRIRFDWNAGQLSFWLNSDMTGEGNLPSSIKRQIINKGVKLPVNESVRDKMTPKSEDDLKTSTKDFPPKKKMDYGVNHGVVHLVKTAIEEGVDVNTKDSYKKTPLIWVTSKSFTSPDDIEIVKVLLEKGADVNHKDSFGMTALMFASHKGDFEVVELLLNNGADASIKDKNNNTAMDFAEIGEHRSVMYLLRRLTKVNENMEKRSNHVS